MNFLPLDDDFKKFQREFPNYIQRRSDLGQVHIVKGKNIYQQRGMKMVFGLMTVMCAVLFGVKIINPESGPSWPTLGVLGTALAFYWLKINQYKN